MPWTHGFPVDADEFRVTSPGVRGSSATTYALEDCSDALAAEEAPIGLAVLIVEPGPFRTGFDIAGLIGNSCRCRNTRTKWGHYATLSPMPRATSLATPAKVAAAVATAIASDNPPLHLALVLVPSSCSAPH